MVDFTGLLGVPGHSCSSGATDPILSTQRIPRWGDPIVSTVQDASDFQAILDGALKNGGDASENGDFQRWKQRLQGTFFSGALISYFQILNFKFFKLYIYILKKRFKYLFLKRLYFIF